MVAKPWGENQKDRGSKPKSQRKAHCQGARSASVLLGRSH